MERTVTSPAGGLAGDPGLVDAVVERLAALQRSDGGWPYQPGQQASFTEPTCWTLMALQAADRLSTATAQAASSFLCGVQLSDGGFHCGTADREANWSATLAVLSLSAIGREPEATRRGVEWLLGFEGRHWKKKPTSFFAHDTALRGWPWLAGCHSWIEPTCYAIFALTSAGLADHPRVAEAARMILDRALPGGGWNYGNTSVLGTELRAFPSTSGIALIALRGSGSGAEPRRGLQYLGRVLPRLTTPWALGWAALAGRYCGFEAFELPGDIDIEERIATCLERQLPPASRVRVHELALLLMSALDPERLPFQPAPEPTAATAAANVFQSRPRA